MKNLIPVSALVLVLLHHCQAERSFDIDLDYTPDKTELFGEGVISTNLYERDMAISPKGDEIIYTLCDYSRSKYCLVIVKRTGGKWNRKEILSFSGQYSDVEPCFSADGDQLFFASDRPMNADTGRKDFNIWVAGRTSGGFGEPEPLPSHINTESNEFFPAVCSNGNLYFTAARENGLGGEDIFLSRFEAGRYLDPEPLDTNINTLTYEFNAWVNPEENLIIFSSFGRKDDRGGGDLYFSRKDAMGNWLPAVNMGPAVNSDRLDYCPFVDIPRGNFYFTSEKMTPPLKKIIHTGDIETLANGILNGMGNIYRVALDTFDPR